MANLKPGVASTLDLGLDIVDGIGRLHLKGDSLTREGFDEDLHIEDLEGREVSQLFIAVMVERCPKENVEG